MSIDYAEQTGFEIVFGPAAKMFVARACNRAAALHGSRFASVCSAHAHFWYLVPWGAGQRKRCVWSFSVRLLQKWASLRI